MQSSVISSLVVLAVVAIGTLQASPSPIRFVTPRPGVDYRIRTISPRPGTDYKIRTITPNPRIRYARSADDDVLLEDPIVEADLESGYESSQLSENRPSESSEEDILTALNIVDEVEHAISKRSPDRRVVINYKPPPPNGPRYARSIEDSEAQEFEIEDVEE